MCRSCSARAAADQRYCLNCGERLADSAVDWRAGMPVPAPVASLPVPPRRVALPSGGRTAAALALAALGTGVLLGGAASPVSSSRAVPRSIVAVAAPTPVAIGPRNPAPVADPTRSDLPDDVAPPPVGAVEGDLDETSSVAAEPPAPSAPEVEPVAEPPAEPTVEPTPEGTTPEGTTEGAAKPESEEPPAAEGPPAKHVVIVSLTGQRFETAFGDGSPATYLSRELPAQGVLLSSYAPVARGSLANQVALLTGLAPTPEQDQDCPAPGTGCRVPASAPSLPAALAAGGRSWKTYVQGRREPCRPPLAEDVFGLQRDPFPYLRGLEADCPLADVDLAELGEDFASSDSAPSLAYVIPDFCHDGRDLNCPLEPDTSGLQRADGFLRFVVPAILESVAFADDGLLIVLFDGGHLPPRAEGVDPPAVGAIVVGRFAAKDKVARRAYDHLSLLRTLAGTFGVAAPGRSADAEVKELGRDVFPSGR